MLMLPEDQVLQCQIFLPSLTECLRISERPQQPDNAVLVTNEGLLLCSLVAWQESALEIINLLQFTYHQGLQVRLRMLAPARAIRAALHDALAQTQQTSAHANQPLDQTRAQQALEDLVQQALVISASDIHLVFTPRQALLAFRVHGRLIGQAERNRETMAAAIAASLNTRSDDFRELFDEQRLSAASISITVAHQNQPQRIRLRVQKSPTRDGFAVTMRLQNEQQRVVELGQLGLTAKVHRQLLELLLQPAGMILIAGPTGQGKTTTLAAINWVIPRTAKVISLEDPIEIIQPHIEQKPVIADHAELNFANMVKVALREDPDVISISEIRDAATAKAAYTAALTGHLVTATVHAHDTFGVLQRLLDLGLSAESLAQVGVLRGILAQRLQSTVCQACVAHPQAPCAVCHGARVSGRQLLTEFLVIDEKVRLALRQGELEQCRKHLLQLGWLSLEQQLGETLEEPLCNA
ncbi:MULTISPECIES: GspE/PulE family protein [Idiomarina]|uniref:GspE/PulE family protein n=1 Tax=Idiomarina TaxID=135575 RepID=UPI00129ADE1B|nr:MULTISPECIES: ATPase, T2SS/T4P/T4SS family [Idiomarina]MDX1524689.1 ATPase, T2SS/T4P/T4SS family [Pseudidiomarina maritima]MRJ41096.1 hypothetical protein [Idiomarina sp. FeN1]NCU56261.1 hypothetical protein [Idiomarina sp. FenA--70]NCU59280.1 hypothetical protein [Idiomarina sp. FenBw--71]UUN12459.1 Flp pilus assembly complex ATPase component TadA [Idiomarina loihiensis]